MDAANLTLLVAFGAGLVSFISPCVLPLVPAYIGHLAGASPLDTSAPTRLRSFAHALAFVLGFSAVFIGFWLTLSLGFSFIGDNLGVIRLIGGSILVLFGLHTLGLLNIPALYQERRIHFRPRKRGLHVSFLVGALFAAGWTPCIGPTLGAIIGLALYQGEAAQGALMFAAYSAGLGIPFLLTGLALGTATEAVKAIGAKARIFTALSGVSMIVVGVLMLTNMWVRMPQYFTWGAV